MILPYLENSKCIGEKGMDSPKNDDSDYTAGVQHDF
jgi:hypothetical protein